MSWLSKPVALKAVGDGTDTATERPQTIWCYQGLDGDFVFLGVNQVRDVGHVLRFQPAEPSEAGDECGGPFWLSGGDWLAEVATLLRVGDSYRILHEHRAGFPSTSGLLIFDGDDLLVHGATSWTHDRFFGSDQTPITLTLGERLPGDGEVDSPCYDHWWERRTRFTLGDESALLPPTESARLGPYRVELWVSTEVEYAQGGCLDSGVNQLSFLVIRRGAEP